MSLKTKNPYLRKALWVGILGTGGYFLFGVLDLLFTLNDAYNWPEIGAYIGITIGLLSSKFIGKSK